jgi:hypothetical protein
MDKNGRKTGGRQKGTPNKFTASVRDAVEAAFNAAGGAEYLRRQADENPVAFMSLLGKVMPREITAEVRADVSVSSIDAGKLSSAALAEILAAKVVDGAN